MRICIKCKINKELDQFRFRKDRNRHITVCKQCMSIQSKEYRNKNIEEITRKHIIFRQINKEKIKIRNKISHEKRKDKIKLNYINNKQKIKENYLINNYGINSENYNNMFNNQGGCCKICKIHQSELKISLCVDHDHVTGKIRGLLCSACNRAIGLLKDDYKILENAFMYLKDSSTASKG